MRIQIWIRINLSSWNPDKSHLNFEEIFCYIFKNVHFAISTYFLKKNCRIRILIQIRIRIKLLNQCGSEILQGIVPPRHRSLMFTKKGLYI